MSRIVETPRDNFEFKVREDGLSFYDLEGIKWGLFGQPDKYWTEEGSIEITAQAEK